MTVLPSDDLAAVEYGKICAHLQKCSNPIGVMDMLIAAHAKTENMTLVTNNVREFECVPDLIIENWVK
ncbi:MAG: PIN domain-containing protein [Oscillospiraceae bacterium]|nr:PIN domain-containing protein [Oscillospiraceae bacterium]